MFVLGEGAGPAAVLLAPFRHKTNISKEHSGMAEAQTTPVCQYSALVCCYSTIDFLTCPPALILCDGNCKFICCEQLFCARFDGEKVEPFPVGMYPEKPEGSICKLGLYCMACELMKPDQADLINCGCKYLFCFNIVGQFPFGEKVPKPDCGIYGINCFQKEDNSFGFGFCAPPFKEGAFTAFMKDEGAGAPENQTVER